MLIFSPSTTVLIYGAGAKGKITEHILKENGIKISAYIDRNAEQLQSDGEIPIFAADDVLGTSFDRDNTVVIISTTNVFLHDEIVAQLNKLLRVRYFICKSHLLNPDDCDKKINQLYDDLYDCMEFRYGIEIPEIEITETVKPCTKIYLSKENNVCAYIPIEYLFSVNNRVACAIDIKEKSLLERYCEQNVAYFSENRSLYEGFTHSIRLEDWQAYLRFKRELKKATANVDFCSEGAEEMDFQRHLRDRYTIYKFMQDAYERETGFFRDNPSFVKWDFERHCFFIIDGNNRVAFLLSKGIMDMPCRMSLEDYEAYNVYSGIEQAASEAFREIYFTVFDFLGKKGISLRTEGGVLVRGDFSEYLLTQFCRSGAVINEGTVSCCDIAVIQIKKESDIEHLPEAKWMFLVLDAEETKLHKKLAERYGKEAVTVIKTVFDDFNLLDIVWQERKD